VRLGGPRRPAERSEGGNTMSEGTDRSAASLVPTPDELGFDPEALRARYAAERAKRLRPDANEQYVEIAGDLARYEVDPYAGPVTGRAPLEEQLDVLVIGGGFGGQLVAVRLQEAGIDDVRILEKAGDFGGTWYWNRYPGAQCDIEGYLYLPLLEETGYVPRERYSFAPEIFAHAQRIGRHFGLYDETCFQTKVREARWDDTAHRWTVTTDRGDRFEARHVVMSSGPLNKPKLPGIPGVETFSGHTFHTSRWDYDYTGGDTTGDLHRLADKRVGIIGTGATAIQCIPHLGRHAAHLYVFQRTPSSVDERNNTPTDPEWVKRLKPGWQAQRNRNFTALLDGVELEDQVRDKWTSPLRKLSDLLTGKGDGELSSEQRTQLAEIADFQKMNDIRDRIDRTVQDPATAEALKPWYGQWCKRPTFNDEYLPTFNRPNVTLVDTGGQGVERITERGVVVDGHHYEVDCLIFATGFEVGTAYTRRSEFAMYGRDGVSLADAWADGMRTFHGFLSHGFPNCFHMGLTQTGLTANFTYMLDLQAKHVSFLVAELIARAAGSVEPTPQAEAEWVQIVTAPTAMTSYQDLCTPGYYNGEGTSNGEGFLQTTYPHGALAFYDMLARWRERGDLEGLIVR
jgi:cation diffusion facilitator CzcD-associated flavoprotein CzcO